VLILQRVPAKELAGAGQPQAAAAAAAAAACATAEPSSGPPTAGEHSSGAGGVAAAATTQQAAPTQPSAAGQQSGAAQTPSGGSSALKYMVMAGTSEKMLGESLVRRLQVQLNFALPLAARLATPMRPPPLLPLPSFARPKNLAGRISSPPCRSRCKLASFSQNPLAPPNRI